MNLASKGRLLGRLGVAVAADLAALAVPLVPRRHRHAWVSSELARGNWPSRPGLDICARNPEHRRESVARAATLDG